ncbi:MAG TPA: tRNA (adenosine(37)-N6)-threonylcarbamoyltransferase complex dimerization subunit type 1 TsaB [bacterium]|jgi:tRNA threonylcarbamoyladenosine biosynthesis protein TsaB|nr:tRNA (adenosine(37)-N6)-threonylcarbamoyltransferase complex dimerization subunit type 1 TsaB [bacterium]
MILIIDTTKPNLITLALKQKSTIVASLDIDTNRNQSEILLPEIEKFLKTQKQKMKDLEAIEVANGEGSFSSLRLGIVTANALGYAFNIPVRDNSGFVTKTKGLNVIDPVYNGEPNIGTK